MTSTQREGLLSDRVQGFSRIDLDDICCPICHNILWKPVACQSCETPFCSACIAQWIETNPRKCPMRCDRYIERPCSRFIIKQLAKLKVDCIHQPNGCEEIVPYEALEKHEEECIHQTEECPGCWLWMSKKNLVEHKAQCELIEWTCPACNLTVRKIDATQCHTDIICLREQLRDVQQHSQEKIHQLESDIQEYKRNVHKLHVDCAENTRKLNTFRKMIMEAPVTIRFDDISVASTTDGVFTFSSSYKNLIWSGFSFMHKDQAKSAFPGTGYATVFIPNGSQYILWSSYSSSIRPESENQVFGIVSLEACAVYSDNVKLTITGRRNSFQIYKLTSALLLAKSQLIELCWTDIDTLMFEPDVELRCTGRNFAPHFILTSLTITSLH